jgi:hypothetical protein
MSPSRFALVFVGLGLVAAWPVAVTETLPLLDYPNHLARMHILASLAGSAQLQRFYETAWHPIPNLAMDAIVPVLTPWLGLAWAGKIFVIVALLTMAGGAAILQRVLFGAWSAWSLLAFLLLYNRFLLWGFVNFLFAVGLALIAFAIWIVLSPRRAMPRIAAGILLALVIYFAHLLVFGLYGLTILGYEGGRLRYRRASLRQIVAELGLVAAIFVPALLVLAVGSPETASGAVVFGRFFRKFDLPFSIFDNYHRPFDVACFLLAAGAIGWAYWRRWLIVAQPIIWPLALLLFAFLALPSQLFTASGADHRVPLLLALLLIGGSRWNGSASLLRAYLGTATVMFFLRMGLIAASWHGSDSDYATLLPAWDLLPPGSRLAVAYPPEGVHVEATPLAHFPALAVARRDAFVPTLFASPAQQPVVLRPEYRALADRTDSGRLWGAFHSGARLEERDHAALEDYDFIAFMAPHPFTLADETGLASVFVAPRLRLYRVIKDGAAP